MYDTTTNLRASARYSTSIDEAVAEFDRLIAEGERRRQRIAKVDAVWRVIYTLAFGAYCLALGFALAS